MDAYGRQVDYLRMSITDRCNESCLYCLPEGFNNWRQKQELLSVEEFTRVVQAAAGLGFRKFRLTGGETIASRRCGRPGLPNVRHRRRQMHRPVHKRHPPCSPCDGSQAVGNPHSKYQSGCVKSECVSPHRTREDRTGACRHSGSHRCRVRVHQVKLRPHAGF